MGKTKPKTNKEEKYEEKYPPIIVGEQIPNTQLWRRYEEGRELYPMFVPISKYQSDSDAHDQAAREALANGFKGYILYGMTYRQFDGEWYSFNLEPWGEKKQ